MAENPSVVNDESGNNYGGINTGGSIGQAQLQYLENLQKLAQNMPAKPVAEGQYFPRGNDVQIGSVSGSIIGNQPIFAPTNRIPFGMFDEMRRNRAEQEAAYYKNFKTYLDKPLANIKAKLENPWAQPEFTAKLQNTADAWLDSYASKLGGDYIKAYVALQNDKNFNKVMTQYSQYAEIYNSVYKQAVETLVKAKDRANFYVSDAEIAEINQFIHAHDSLETLSIDQLSQKAERFAAKESMFKLAEAATAGTKTTVREYFEANPDINLSSDEQEAWVKNKITGDSKQVDVLINNVIEANPWIKEDNTQKALLESEIRNRIQFGVEKEIQLVKKENAERDMAIKKFGVTVDEGGNVQLGERPAALVNARGTNALTYKAGGKPVNSYTGMTGYVLYNGKLRYVKLPDSYVMAPAAEYDIMGTGNGVPEGRYVESKIFFQTSSAYKPENVRTASKAGEITDQTVIGLGRGTDEKLPARLVDAINGEAIELYGETTILTPFDEARTLTESVWPEELPYLHKKMAASYGPYTARRDRYYSAKNKVEPTYAGPAPIDIPAGADMSFIEDTDKKTYRWNGKVVTGQQIWDKVGRGK